MIKFPLLGVARGGIEREKKKTSTFAKATVDKESHKTDCERQFLKPAGVLEHRRQLKVTEKGITGMISEGKRILMLKLS